VSVSNLVDPVASSCKNIIPCVLPAIDRCCDSITEYLGCAIRELKMARTRRFWPKDDENSSDSKVLADDSKDGSDSKVLADNGENGSDSKVLAEDGALAVARRVIAKM
jgi:hypothetical protein